MRHACALFKQVQVPVWSLPETFEICEICLPFWRHCASYHPGGTHASLALYSWQQYKCSSLSLPYARGRCSGSGRCGTPARPSMSRCPMGCTPTASLSGMRPSRERLSISHASSDPTSVACYSTFGGQGYSVTPSTWNSCLLPCSLQLYAKLSEGPQVFKRAWCRPHAPLVACFPVPCLVLSPAQWLQGSHRQRGLQCAEPARQAQCPRLRPARAACHSLWLTYHILPETCQISPDTPLRGGSQQSLCRPQINV